MASSVGPAVRGGHRDVGWCDTTGNGYIPCRIGRADVVVSGKHDGSRPKEKTMRFLMTTGENSRQPDEALFAEMGAFIDEMTAAGKLVVTGGLGPDARRMETVGDEVTVTDGPFTEAKEAILGFAIIDAGSWDEAMEIAKRFRAIVGDGQSTMHQVFGP
jgi:hypothetical protein